jgi:hypothetical protein
VRFVVLAIVGLEVFYLLAANIILRIGLFQHVVNSDPNFMYIAFEGGWTIVPGRIHFRNLEIRQQDNNVQSLLMIEEGVLQLEFLPLAKKRFHATSVHGTGTSFRFRHKVSKESIVPNLERLAMYPPIHGYSDPPIRGFPWPRSPPSRLWKIELDGVDADVYELWFLEFRYTGSARVEGAFRLMPGERLWVGPAVLTMGPGQLTLGEERVIAPEFDARLWVKIDDFDVNDDEGWQIFKPINVRGWLTMDLPDLDFSELYLPPDVKLTKGGGRVSLVGAIDHGTFTLGSRIDYATDAARLVTSKLELRGGLAVAIAVEPGPDKPIGVARASSPRLEVDAKRAGVGAAVLTSPEVEVAGTAVQLTEEWNLARAHVNLPSIHVPDLALMNVLTAPADVLARQGNLKGKAHIAIDGDGRLTGKLDATVREARVVIQKVIALQGNGSIVGRIAQAKYGRGPGQIEDLTIALEPLSVTSHDATSGHGSLRVAKGAVMFRDLAPDGFKGTLSLELPSALPILDAIGAKTDAIPGMAKAIISNDNLKASVRVSHDPTVTDIEVLEAHTDNMSAQGRYRRDRAKSHGAFLIHTKFGNAGVSIQNGDTHVKVFAGEGWFHEQLQKFGLLREKGGT